MLYFNSMHNAAIRKNKIKKQLRSFMACHIPDATIYHQHIIPTKFHGFSSVTEKTGRYQEVILAVNNNNNIYPRSSLALAVFSGACFSGRRCYGEVTIVKRFIKSLNGLSAVTK